MSKPEPTANDCRDRLVDRVIAEALGAERPPDLSQAILRRVADAQAEVATASQGRTVMASRRVWVTLLATAASLMIAATLVFQTQFSRDSRQVVLVDGQRAASAVGRADESALKYAETQSSPTQTLPAESSPTATVGEFAALSGRGANSDSQRALMDKTVPLSKDISSAAAPAKGAPMPALVDAASPMQSSERDRQQEFMEAHNRQLRARAKTEENPPIAFYDSMSRAIPASPAPATVGAPAPLVGDHATVSSDLDAPFRQGSFNGPQPMFGGGGMGGGVGGEASGQLYSGPESGTAFSFRRGGYKEVELASRDRYEPIHENAFVKPVGEDALSTFSIDVDTASYTNVRQYLLDMRQAPPADAVRIEELVNYFDYAYEAPPAPTEGTQSETPFAANLGCAPCPWKPEHKLVRIGVKGREVDAEKRPLSNLVFLVDVSGSMNEPNKLPLVITGLQALADRLGENDRVAIVVYAGSEGVVLPSTSGDHRDEIRSALGRLQAGGSTAGGAGLRLAYEIAERNKIPGGVNRVVLCTDGDFNVGMTGTEELAQFVETRAKETNVYLTVLGFGRGNLNDAMLEQISGRGDGHYAYIDNETEARRVLSHDLSGTLVAIAKDVKLQVEFNPAKVASYRLIGYENRVMAAEDFNNDAKDAGDIGAGHTVTALYEIVPVGVEAPAPAVDGLKYQGDSAAVGDDAAHTKRDAEPTAASKELLTLKVRYKQPEGGASKKLEFPLEDTSSDKSVGDADADFRWAAAVAEFGMLLRNSRYAGDGSFDAVLELARGAIGEDPHGYRAEFIEMVRRAKEVSGR